MCFHTSTGSGLNGVINRCLYIRFSELVKVHISCLSAQHLLKLNRKFPYVLRGGVLRLFSELRKIIPEKKFAESLYLCKRCALVNGDISMSLESE